MKRAIISARQLPDLFEGLVIRDRLEHDKILARLQNEMTMRACSICETEDTGELLPTQTRGRHGEAVGFSRTEFFAL